MREPGSVSHAEVLLRAEGLRLGYGACELLHGIDVEVRAGELVGVLGANGAGKTTLLRALSGLLRPTEGRVTVVGEDLATLDARAIARRVAVLPQDAGPLFPLSVLQAVLLGRAPWHPGWSFESPEDVRIARECLAAVGASELEERDLTRLSGGERQRVHLARALAQQGRLLLCDEPTSRLDLRAKGEVFRHLRDQATGERGVLVITHELELAAAFCDRLVLLGEGRVVAAGSADQVLTSEHLETAFGVAVAVERDSVGRPRIVREPTEDWRGT